MPAADFQGSRIMDPIPFRSLPGVLHDTPVLGTLLKSRGKQLLEGSRDERQIPSASSSYTSRVITACRTWYNQLGLRVALFDPELTQKSAALLATTTTGRENARADLTDMMESASPGNNYDRALITAMAQRMNLGIKFFFFRNDPILAQESRAADAFASGLLGARRALVLAAQQGLAVLDETPR